MINFFHLTVYGSCQDIKANTGATTNGKYFVLLANIVTEVSCFVFYLVKSVFNSRGEVFDFCNRGANSSPPPPTRKGREKYTMLEKKTEFSDLAYKRRTIYKTLLKHQRYNE